MAVSLAGCEAQPQPRKEAYAWLSSEAAPKDPSGRPIKMPTWANPWQLPAPVDTFVVYPNSDSIRLISVDFPAGTLFIRFELHGYRWKPKPDYLGCLFLLGTYMRKDLPGMIVSIYATKDWRTVMQVFYTNPGNMNAAFYFSKDSVNLFRKAGKIVDPNDELTEPEKPVVTGANQ